MPPAAIAEVVDVWRRETRELGARPEVRQVLCFENKGDVVGVSNPHPHGQIYATSFVWKTIETELAASERHQRDTGRGLMADIIRAEQQDGRRVLHEDEHVIAFVPYFARYAYEVYVVPKRRVAHVFDARRRRGRRAGARAVRRHHPFRQPVAHVVSLRDGAAPGAHRRARRRYERVPLLHRVSSAAAPADLLKYLAGPEIGGGNFLSDTSPEAKAAELKALPAVHHAAPAPPGANPAQRTPAR